MNSALIWEIAFLAIVVIAFLLLSKDWTLPRKFYQREDTRRIRSYFKKKNAVAELENELKEVEVRLREEERELQQKKHAEVLKKLR